MSLRIPAATVNRDAPVLSAVKLMDEKTVGAVAVVDGQDLCGIFTYRDLVTRVLLEGKSLTDTLLSDVMTREVQTLADQGVSFRDAIRVMVENDYTYIPVVEGTGRVVGMLALRDLLEHRVEHMSAELNAMVNYLATDGAGG